MQGQFIVKMIEEVFAMSFNGRALVPIKFGCTFKKTPLRR